MTFDAFFADTMFHEVAHGLGIKNTVNGRGTVRGSHKEFYSGIEEGKADVLGLYMITKLHEKGELSGSLEDLLHDVPGRHLPFGAIRRGLGARRGEHGQVQFLRRPRRVRP